MDPGTGHARRSFTPYERLLTSLMAGWLVLLAPAALLLARRFSGALIQPLPEVLILCLLSGVCLAALALQFLGRSLGLVVRRIDWIDVVAGVTPLAWGISLLAGSSPLAVGGVCAVWLLHGLAVVCVAGGCSAEFFAGILDRGPERADTPVASVVTSQSVVAEESVVVDESVAGDESWPYGPDVSQWQTRSRWPGGVAVSGGVVVEFQPGERETSVHLTFTPPFEQTPELSWEDLDEAGWDIRLGTAQAFGGRLTVRRSGPVDEPVSGRIGYAAVVEATAKAA